MATENADRLGVAGSLAVGALGHRRVGAILGPVAWLTAVETLSVLGFRAVVLLMALLFAVCAAGAIHPKVLCTAANEAPHDARIGAFKGHVAELEAIAAGGEGFQRVFLSMGGSIGLLVIVIL